MDFDFAKIDICIDCAEVEKTPDQIYEGLVVHKGIAYFEFPIIIDAHQIRERLISLKRSKDTYNEIFNLSCLWDLYQVWPVVFSPNEFGKLQMPAINKGHHTKYPLLRERFHQVGDKLWIDKWATEILGEKTEVGLNAVFLEKRAAQIKKYLGINSL